MTNQTDISKPRHCEYCTSIFPSGSRIDRRFCNDNCRNTFNKVKRKAAIPEDYSNLSEILKTIKHNHELLKEYDLSNLEKHGFKILSKSSLEQKGFNFKFFSSVHKDIFGKYWNCCFDFGWRKSDYSDDTNDLMFSYFPDQIKLE